MPPEPLDRRRPGDLMLADFDKRLALIEQGNDLHAKANEARSQSLQHAVDGLATEVRQALQLIATANADPTATPSGRQLIAAIDDVRNDAVAGDAGLRRDVEEQDAKVAGHQQFIDETRGALRLARFALGTSMLSVLGNIALGLIYLSSHHP